MQLIDTNHENDDENSFEIVNKQFQRLVIAKRTKLRLSRIVFFEARLRLSRENTITKSEERLKSDRLKLLKF